MSRTGAGAWLVAAAVAVAVFGPVISAAGAPVGAGRVSLNTPLGEDNSPTTAGDLPGLAADPANPDHIVEIEEQSRRGQCAPRVTFDGGRTWAGGDLTAPPDFDPVPCETLGSGGYAHFGQSVSFGSDQNVYTAFSSRRRTHEASEGESVLVARSSDGGKTWATGVEAIAGSAHSVPYYVRPQLAVEPRAEGDRVYVSAWGADVTPDGGGGGRMVTTRSDDGGETFAPTPGAPAPDEEVGRPSEPAIGPGGAVYVAWPTRGGGPSPDHIAVARSTDQGTRWTRSQAGSISAPDDPDGGSPRLAVDSHSGNVYLVYVGRRSGGPGISFQRSSDGGTTWSAPIGVDDNGNGGNMPPSSPHLSLAPNGRIDVVWMDAHTGNRQPATPDPTAMGDVRYASSSDGGETFSPPRRITDHYVTLDPGVDGSARSRGWYGPVTTALGNDRVMFAWGDGRNASVDTEEVYTATMQLDASGQAPVAALPGTSPEDLSVNLSRLAHPGRSEKADGRAAKVVVANENDTASALAGAVLAGAEDAPLLLATASDLTASQKEEVSRLGAGGAYAVGAASSLSDKVLSSLVKAGARETQRLNSGDSADTARRIALMLDRRDNGAKARGAPAFDAAVIVNPQSPDAATGTALAAALRMPVLFTQRDTIPPATNDALRALGIETTLVVGDTGSVGEGVRARLPGSKRLGGGDPTLTSEAVATEAVARGLPANVVYITDGERPVEQAAVGAVVARLGGIMLAEPDASPAAARRSLEKLGLAPLVDRLLVARADLGGANTGLRLVLAILIFAIGVTIVVVALAHRDDQHLASAGEDGGPTRDRVATRGNQ